MTKLTIDTTGWLQTVEVIKSPNCDARPDKNGIKLIVIHGISLPPAEFGGGYIQDLFCNRLDPDKDEYFESIFNLKVSSHCLIERDGNLIQFVSFLDRAWHAGVSSWQGEVACNNYSIGIELEGTDYLSYTDSQYQQLYRLIRCIRLEYSTIDANALCGHSEIAPGRKTDPGAAFDWPRLKSQLAQDIVQK
jgi:AmpD protein